MKLRIWSVFRTTAQIEQAMDAPLALDPAPTRFDRLLRFLLLSTGSRR